MTKEEPTLTEADLKQALHFIQQARTFIQTENLLNFAMDFNLKIKPTLQALEENPKLKARAEQYDKFLEYAEKTQRIHETRRGSEPAPFRPIEGITSLIPMDFKEYTDYVKLKAEIEELKETNASYYKKEVELTKENNQLKELKQRIEEWYKTIKSESENPQQEENHRFAPSAVKFYIEQILKPQCDHKYETSPMVLTSNPPQSLKICVKCGDRKTEFIGKLKPQEKKP